MISSVPEFESPYVIEFIGINQQFICIDKR